MTGPEVSLSPQGDAVSTSTVFEFRTEDEGSGLRSISILATQNGVEKAIRALLLDEGAMKHDLAFSLKDVGLKDGQVNIVVRSADRSIFNFGAGNTTVKTYSFLLDTKPPRISTLSTAHNLNHGGAGLVSYRISEPAIQSGIQVGDYFFPGYLQANGDYVALFSYPYDMDEADFIPKVVAEDAAGNRNLSGIYFNTIEKRFKKDRINISDRFLDSKMPQFESLFPNEASNLDLFLRVNRDLRSENRARLGEIGAQTSPSPLWSGSFIRQPQSATRSTFGDRRTYYYQGKKVDNQTHLGVDLASVKHDEIVSINDGEVVFADFFGIYGLCVIVDHGLGLQSLYSHLSQIQVAAGDVLNKGDILGLSGMTGMAGGDHLHLGILISGIPVNPVEWWDNKWIENNIDSKLP